MAAHADQYATFQERLAETQRKQADMQELFKQEMLAEQRKQGELVNAQLRTIAKQLTDSSVLRKREREDHIQEISVLSRTNVSIVAELTALSARFSSMERTQGLTEEANALLNAAMDDVQKWLVSKVKPIYIHLF